MTSSNSTPPPTMNIYLTTFNLNLKAATLTSKDIKDWFQPAFSARGDPDVVVVGVQELLPLQWSLSGWADSTLSSLSSQITSILSSLSSNSTEYVPLSQISHGGTALLVFIQAEYYSQDRVGRIIKSSVALGTLGMGNKAAVGIRVVLNRGKSWETFTFISSHLSAHDKNLSLRNTQYKTVLSSLLFTRPSGTSSLDPSHYQVWQSSHVFWMGDLNYRLSKLGEGIGHDLNENGIDTLNRNGEVDVIQSEALIKERSVLLSLDTLKQNQLLGKTMVGFNEGDLKGFAPTYKRFIGAVEGWDRKRIPGWTDRIFWASWNDGDSGEDQVDDVGETAALLSQQQVQGTTSTTGSSSTTVLAYNSIPKITFSDHKPVYTILSVPTSSSSSTASIQSIQNLISPRDPIILLVNRFVGLVLDRVVGYAWLLSLLLGGGKLMVGVAVELGLVLLMVGRILSGIGR